MPRNAENTVDTGGSPAAWWATPAGTPWARSPDVQRGRQPVGQADDQQREEHADRQRHPGVLERRPHPGRGTAVGGRHAAHDRRGVRRGEHPRPDPVEHDQQRERPVREVDRQQQQPEEARARTAAARRW